MVFDAADDQCRRVVIAADSGEVGVRPPASFHVFKKRATVFRREDDVHIEL